MSAVDRVRVTFSESGYRYISDAHPSVAGSETVLEHRLTAVAWGILDGLDDSREIHHLDSSPLHTAESNLRALSREAHLRRELEEFEEAGESPPSWLLNSVDRLGGEE